LGVVAQKSDKQSLTVLDKDGPIFAATGDWIAQLPEARSGSMRRLLKQVAHTAAREIEVGLSCPMTTADSGGVMDHLELSAHMKVRPGCLEGFKKQAAELIRITKEMDTRTLRYDWFLSTDGAECEVREAYTGPEGLIEHNSHILEARTLLFREYRTDTS
jgi:hypothetical protein